MTALFWRARRHIALKHPRWHCIVMWWLELQKFLHRRWIHLWQLHVDLAWRLDQVVVLTQLHWFYHIFLQQRPHMSLLIVTAYLRLHAYVRDGIASFQATCSPKLIQRYLLAWWCSHMLRACAEYTLWISIYQIRIGAVFHNWGERLLGIARINLTGLGWFCTSTFYLSVIFQDTWLWSHYQSAHFLYLETFGVLKFVLTSLIDFLLIGFEPGWVVH